MRKAGQTNEHGSRNQRKGHDMYAILTFFAAFISLMFVATAASSIINSFREGEAVRVAATRRITF